MLGKLRIAMSSISVEGLDWFGAATPRSIWSGSFYVISNPADIVLPSDLVVTSTSYRSISPVFYVSIDKASRNKLIVKFVVSIGGAFPVALKFRGNPLNSPQGLSWNLYSDDASLSLTKYIPGDPPVLGGFSIGSGTVLQASVQDDMLHFSKTTQQAIPAQWRAVSWSIPSLSAGPPPPGLFFTYRIRWNSLGGTREVKLDAPSFVNPSQYEVPILRSWDGTVHWMIYDSRRTGWITQSPSGISANGEWHDLLFYASSDAIRIYEDGQNVVSKPRTDFIPGAFDMCFSMAYNVFDASGFFDSDMMDFSSCPAAIHQDLPELISTPTELIFNPASSFFNREYFSVSNWNGPIQVTQTENSLRFNTKSLTQKHHTVYTSYIQKLRAYSVIQYRFKVNTAGGFETKVTIAGNVVLRTEYGISRWQFWSGSGFSTLSSSTNFRPGGPYVDVLVIVSPKRVTLFENGEFKFEHVVSSSENHSLASFSVQHFEVGGEVDVELSHLRIVSGAS